MNILKGTVSFGGWTMFSRVLGFLRDIAMANKLGTSMASDAFFVALILPNLLRRLVAEGAFNVVFVPIFSRLKDESEESAKVFAASVFTLLMLVVTATVVVAEIFMPYVVMAIAPGYIGQPEKIELITFLGRITFPYLLFIAVASLMGGICNTLGRFAPFAFVPTLLNISFIVCLFVLPGLGVSPAVAAAVAVPAGGVAQVVFMWVAMRRAGFRLGLKWPPKHSKLKPLLLRMGPAALTVGVLQVSFLIDTWLASFLQGPAISYLQYANRFYQLPLSLIGVAVATVLLPHLSRLIQKGQTQAVSTQFANTIVGAGALALAATVGLFLLANPLMSTLLEHGKFNAESTHHAAMAMMAYSLGLFGYVIAKITASVFYAHEDAKTPVKASVLALGINVVANLILMQYWGHVGIALATAISGFFNAGIQLWWVHKRGLVHINLAVLATNLGKAFAVAVVMAGALLVFQHYVPFTEVFWQRFLWVVAATALGLAVFAVGAELTKLFPIRRVVSHLRS